MGDGSLDRLGGAIVVLDGDGCLSTARIGLPTVDITVGFFRGGIWSDGLGLGRWFNLGMGETPPLYRSLLSLSLDELEGKRGITRCLCAFVIVGCLMCVRASGFFSDCAGDGCRCDLAVECTTEEALARN